jgi:large subunit ribosomal protein L30
VSAAKSKTKRVRVTWTRSAIGRDEKQGRIIAALGLRRLNQTVEHDDSPTIRGMINKVPHLVEVEEAK